LLLIQTTQEQIHLMMKPLVLMKRFLLAMGTLTGMNLGCGHWLLQ
jgi:hypothetical protein